MKSFLQILTEETKPKHPIVVTFGRMNPPTTGHLKLINHVRHIAGKENAEHEVIVSHSQDTKKNPLSTTQKLKHLKRYSPGTNFVESSKEQPSLLHHLSRLHAQGHDHLIMVAGSDRVKEYQDLIKKYNGVKGKHGYYNFKKIEVRSAGHRDPDAEGEEGISGTKMREHAKNNDFSSFRQGVPSHVSDDDAKDLMHDVRHGMGINEDVNRGMFKAIILTGGPGSGKDVILRESIPETKFIEIDLNQSYTQLADKNILLEGSSNYRKSIFLNRYPVIINGISEDVDKILYIKEELEELGYSTMMIFVGTSNEISRERNSLHSKKITESTRYKKWKCSQINKNIYQENFNNFCYFDNSLPLDQNENELTEVYKMVNIFIEQKNFNESAIDWFKNNGRLRLREKFDGLLKRDKESRSLGPDDITPDNRPSDTNADNIKWDAPKRTKTYTFRTYSESGPTLKVNPEPKTPNFNKDKESKKKDRTVGAPRIGRPSGVGPEYDSRAGGQSAAAGAGLGNQTYSEDMEYDNSQVTTPIAGSSNLKPNPLSGSVNPFIVKYKKKKMMEYADDADSGLGGVLGGASNKEGMDSYSDVNRRIQNDYTIKRKKVRK